MSGTYEFELHSDDQSEFKLDGEVVATATCCEPVTGSIDLQSNNAYHFHLEWQENWGHAFIHLRWKVPGTTDFVPVPYSAFKIVMPVMEEIPFIEPISKENLVLKKQDIAKLKLGAMPEPEPMPEEEDSGEYEGMLVRWWTGDKTNIVDTYIVTEGDENLPKHEGSLSYEWGGDFAQGNNWETNHLFGAIWDGYFYSTVSGTYDFELHSDDQSEFLINGKHVVSAHCCSAVTASINLEANMIYHFHLEW